MCARVLCVCVNTVDTPRFLFLLLVTWNLHLPTTPITKLPGPRYILSLRGSRIGYHETSAKKSIHRQTSERKVSQNRLERIPNLLPNYHHQPRGKHVLYSLFFIFIFLLFCSICFSSSLSRLACLFSFSPFPFIYYVHGCHFNLAFLFFLPSAFVVRFWTRSPLQNKLDSCYWPSGGRLMGVSKGEYVPNDARDPTDMGLVSSRMSCTCKTFAGQEWGR